MSCEHEVRFTIKPTDDACRFHFDVRAYKDRIVAPDEYSGPTEVTPSSETQVLQTKDKLVRDDIVINPAPEPDLRPLAVSENGSYQPDEFDGYSDVTVDVEPALDSLTVTENGLYLPESGTDGFDRVSVDVLSVMDKLLEVVSSVTPNENTKSMEFPLGDIKTGMYIIVSDPPGTREFASQQTAAETLNMTEFDIRGVTGGPFQCIGRTICYRQTPTSTNETDWWAPKLTLGENSITVDPTSGRYGFIAGVTYYLLRVKGA